MKAERVKRMNNNDIPVIKTFIIDNQFYVYDTYTNNIIKVSSELYKEIQKLISLGVSKYKKLDNCTIEHRDVLWLIEKGYFKSNFIKNIIHPDTSHISYLLNRGVNDLTLQVTRDCNFKCRYCLFSREQEISRHHEKINMTLDIAKKSIDFLFEKSKDSNEVCVSFYGGEPLLNYSLIKKIVEYADSIFLSKRINYHMTTNGSLITQSIAAFLAKHKFNLLISLDGPEKVQNNHRKMYIDGKGTYYQVIQGIKNIKEASIDYFNEYVDFIPVLFPDESYREIIDYFQSVLGISEERISYTYANLDGIDYIEGNEKIKEISSIMNNDWRTKLNRVKMKNDLAVRTVIPENWHPNGQCIAGVNRLFINTYGVFYPCEKVLEHPIFSIGNLYDGFDESKVVEMTNLGKINEDACASCWAMRFCDVCISKCIDIESECISSSQKEILCTQVREKNEQLLKEIIKEENK